jgi:hypothetical protein
MAVGPSAGQRFLVELRAFLSFLHGLWGVLSSVSLLFPLSNLFFDVLPVSKFELPFVRLSSQAVTTLATLTCLFAVLASFARRRDFHAAAARRRFARVARVSFAVAVAACVAYLLGYSLLYNGKLELNSEPAKLAWDAAFAALYVLFFALTTRAFLLLAMLEYFPEQSDSTAPKADR